MQPKHASEVRIRQSIGPDAAGRGNVMTPLKAGEAAMFMRKLATLARDNEATYQGLDIAVVAARRRLARFLAWQAVGRDVANDVAEAREAVRAAKQHAEDARLVQLVVNDVLEETRDQARAEVVDDQAGAIAEQRTVYDSMLTALDRDWKKLSTPEIRKRGSALEAQARKARCYQALKERVRERFANRPRGDVLVDLLRIDGA